MDQYPPSVRGSPTARTYGNHDPDLSLALVWHSTETVSWPGFRRGLTAPHHSYKPATREWRWHGAPVDQRVGTMRSSLRTRTPANEKAYQVEIIAYSNRRIADKDPRRLWIGDFTDDNYRDLAAFATWLSDQTTIRLGQVTPTPPGGWRFGSASPLRLERNVWLGFAGMTAHGAVTGQTHWDTGVLDLGRIDTLAIGVGPPPPSPTLEDTMWPLKLNDGKPGSSRAYKFDDVIYVQKRLRRLGHKLSNDGWCGPKTIALCAKEVGLKLTDEITGEAGERLDHNSIRELSPAADPIDPKDETARRAAAAAQVEATRANTRLDNV